MGWRAGARVIDLGVWIAVAFLLRLLPLASIWLFLWTLGWLVVPLWRGGATAGKRLLGIRVVRTDGSSVVLGRAVVREAFVLVSIAIPVVGVLNALTAVNDPRTQALHDKIAATLVLRPRPLERR